MSRRSEPPDLFIAAPSEMGAALTMEALPPDEQIRWLLAFLDEDLAGLSAEQRRKHVRRLEALKPANSARRAWRRREKPDPQDDGLIAGTLRLRWVANPWNPRGSTEELGALQREIAAGVRLLLTGGEWRLPGPTGAWLRRARFGGFQWVWEADGRSAILLGVAELLYDCASHLRACAHCERPFLAVKRQEYCTPEHGQLARDQKKKRVRKKGGAR